MNCEQYELPIALHVEGDLTALESIQIEAHLATCVACHNFANELRTSQAAFRTTSLDDFSETMLADLRHSVMQNIADRATKLSFWQRWFRPLRWQYATAGFVALLLLSTMLGQLKFNRQPDTTKAIVTAPPQVEPKIAEKKIRTSDDAPERRFFLPVKHSPQKKRIPLRPQSVLETASPNLIVAVALPGDSPMPAPVFFASDTLPDDTNDSSAAVINENAADEIRLPLNDNKVRLEIQTRDPNVRIILFVDKEPRRVTDTE